LFAFDKDQGLSEHTAPFDAFLHLLEGEVMVTIDGLMHVLTAGEMIMMPAKKPHAVTATKRCKILLTMIKS
jgi:quercetin dioxygenase-like cupin family protein